MKEKKIFRYNHFQVVINLYDPDIPDFVDISNEDLIPIMQKMNFVSQRSLEKILLDANFSSRDTGFTNFSEFQGQLERGSISRRPHWQLFLKTRLKTTASKVRLYLSQQIYDCDNHSSISVDTMNNPEETISYVSKPGRLILESSVWYPGVISRRIAEANRLLEDDELMKLIHGGFGRPFQNTLLEIANSTPNDRTINWVACFTGNSRQIEVNKIFEKYGFGRIIVYGYC